MWLVGLWSGTVDTLNTGIVWLAELVLTLADAARTGDLRGHLRAWWEVTVGAMPMEDSVWDHINCRCLMLKE